MLCNVKTWIIDFFPSYHRLWKSSCVLRSMTNSKKFSACRKLQVKVRSSNDYIWPVLTVCQSLLIQKRRCIVTGHCAKPAQSSGEKSDKESKAVRSSPWVLKDPSSLLLNSSSHCPQQSSNLIFLSFKQETGPSRKRKSSTSLSDIEGTYCIST